MTIARFPMLAVVVAFVLIPSVIWAQSHGGRGWSGAAEVSFVSTSGNSETQTIGLAGDLTLSPGAWTTEVKLAFIRSKANNQLNAKSFDMSAQGTRQIDYGLGVYTKTGYLRDRFAGINNRYAVEGGVSFNALTGTHTLTARGGGGWTQEQRALRDDRNMGTANSSADYIWALTETSQLRNEATLTLVLRDRDDWRFTNKFSVSAALNGFFSLKLSHQLGYLNDPVPGFEKTDIKVSAAVVANF